MTTIEAVQGDITAERVDAVVNAANSLLLGGGGVDGAIHAAAGPTLLHECRRLRAGRFHEGLPVGQPVATGAGNLPAQWVIHTVGPNRHRGQTDPALLASCFSLSVAEAARVGATSVAFPAVGAGVYGWDAAIVAEVAVGAIRAALAEGTVPTARGDQDVSAITLIRFVLFSPQITAAFEAARAAG